MAASKIDARELTELLDGTPASQNVMLVGRHGIGKSQIISSYFAKRKMIVIPFFLGQMSDPGDLIGLFHKDEKTGRSIFLPPFWWPQNDEPVVLFLDELNRARPEILQTVMDLVLNKSLAGKKLPEGSIVISAVNDGDEYQLTELDPALVSRFNIYEFSPTIEDWLVWAADADLDSRVIGFIQENPLLLDSDPKIESQKSSGMPFGGDLTKTPDRRAWEKVAHLVSDVDSLADIHTKLIAGVIGIPAALLFCKTLRSTPSITADDLLFRFGKIKAALTKLSVPDFANLNEQTLLRLQSGKKMTAAVKKTALGNFTAYLELLKSEGHSEAIAHLANQLENPRFEKANQTLLSDLKILNILAEFIEAIDIY